MWFPNEKHWTGDNDRGEQEEQVNESLCCQNRLPDVLAQEGAEGCGERTVRLGGREDGRRQRSAWNYCGGGEDSGRDGARLG